MARFNILGFQYFTNDNEVLAGGKINFYDSATSTRKTTYSNAELTIANTNPVVLDASGRAPSIFFAGSAKAVLTDSDGVVIETLDPVGDTSVTPFQEWNTEFTYPKDIVVVGPDGYFYVSLVNGNFANDPTISASEWKLLTQFLGFESANNGYSWVVDSAEPQKVKAVPPLYTLVTKTTATNAATVDFTGLSADYGDYVVVLSSVIPANDDVSLQMRTSANNGSSYDSGASDYEGFSGKLSGGSAYASTGFTAGVITLATQVGSDTNETGINANVYVFNPSVAQYCQGRIEGSYMLASTNTNVATGAFVRNSAAAVNAIRLFFSAGNIESGTFALYGVRRT